MNEPWNIQLFGGLRVRQTERIITRFRTQKTGALLAYLAYYRGQSHPREVLIEMFWPDTAPESGRHNLSHALSSLRNLLEPPGVSAGSVVVADRFSVELNPAAVTTDVVEFEQSFRAAIQARNTPKQLSLLLQALENYAGALLPDQYEDWIVPEQERLAQRFRQAAAQSISLLAKAGRAEEGLEIARRVVAQDPLDEEANAQVVRLLALIGRVEDSLRHYREYERLLDLELGETPGSALSRLARQIEEDAARRKEQGVWSSSDEEGATGASQTASPDVPVREFPPPLPIPRSRLPLQFTRFIGREEEIARIVEILALPTTRLLTLTGPGGTGKTRLGIEGAGRFADGFSGTIWFVPLADLTDHTLIPQAVLQAMSVSLSSTQEPQEQLVAVLSNRPTLLLLDNYEHLVEGGAELLLTLMSRVETLQCLVTSRQTLGLPGETEFAVIPLPTPNGSDTPERLSLFESVQLFVDRAQAARPDFRITSRNAPAVAELCDRLEGIPLAIELAAARALVLSPSQMLVQLGNRFEFLVSRKRGIAERQRTLRATVDWSYRLLAPDLQRFFVQLGVFRGGWTVGAAEAVCRETLALDMLAQLCECSLVTATESGGSIRFRMLETLREYAEEQLSVTERASLAVRHAEYFVAEMEQAEALASGSNLPGWLNRLEAEQDNLRAVLVWSSAPEGDPETGLRLAGAIFRYWEMRYHLTEGRKWLVGLLTAEVSGRAASRGKALIGAGTLAWRQSDFPAALAFFEESLAISREHGDRPNIATSLVSLGNLACIQCDYPTARALYEEGLAIRRELGNDKGVAGVLDCLGNAALGEANYPAARALFEESLARNRKIGNLRGMTFSLTNLGNVALRQGDFLSARAPLEESLAISRELRDGRGIVSALTLLGDVDFAEADYTAARNRHIEVLYLSREVGVPSNIIDSLEGIASVLAALSEPVRAAPLWGATERLREEIGMPRPPSLLPRFEQEVLDARAVLADDAAFDHAWQEGRAMTMEQAAAYALEAAGE